MAPRSSIEFAESAVADLEDVIAWYADQQVPEVGRRLVGEVVAQVERLADFPESGRIVPEFELANLREIIHPPFRIVYRVDAARIRIVRVWRSELLMKVREGSE
ncbi:type II toxin-antitoxin system RelE/ParE family toxin [Geobacter anodireducens]